MEVVLNQDVCMGGMALLLRAFDTHFHREDEIYPYMVEMLVEDLRLQCTFT